MRLRTGAAVAYPKNYVEFISLFNEKKFFEAHEVLELEWHREKGANNFYKALIQLAAALVHLEKGEARGARRLVGRAKDYLAPYRPRHQGLDVACLVADIVRLEETLASDRVRHELVRIPVLALKEQENTSL